MPSLPDALTTRAQELARDRVPIVAATVVRAQSPTSSRAGDAALVHASGEIEGFVGGTCAEASVREYGLQAMSCNEPLLLRIAPGEPSDVRSDLDVELTDGPSAICGMSVAAVAATLHVDRAGTTTYFCGAACRTTFLADPERYALTS